MILKITTGDEVYHGYEVGANTRCRNSWYKIFNASKSVDLFNMAPFLSLCSELGFIGWLHTYMICPSHELRKPYMSTEINCQLTETTPLIMHT